MKKIYVPGSKSVSNRVLVLAALSSESTILYNLLISNDIIFLKNALIKFGVIFEEQKNGGLKIIPPKQLKGNNSDNFIGNGGTPARFLVALSTILEGTFSLKGVERMYERPFLDLFEAIGSFGVDIEYLGQKGFLPAKFSNKGLETMNRSSLKISGKVSSQFISGLLLVAPKFENGLEIEVSEAIQSLPYVKMTVEILKIWGVSVEVSQNYQKFKILPGLKSPREFLVPADSSSASYPIAYSLLKKEKISIENFGIKTFQGDEKFLEVAEKFGAKVVRFGDKVQIQPPEVLTPLGEIDFSTMPDVSMTGMILASFSKGYSEFYGLESLRVKECDRIEAMRQGLVKLGVRIEVKDDIVKIWGDEAVFRKDEKILNSFDDHRIAMVFGIVRLVLKASFQITDQECVAKSWPEFWLELSDWNNELRSVSAIILEKVQDGGLQYLIVKKPRKDYAWQFPQGGKEEGEMDKKAAERELKEECGEDLNVKFKGENSIGDYKYLFPKDFKRHKKGVFGVHVKFFRADYLNGLVKVDGEEIIDHAWVKKENLKDFFEVEYLERIQFFL
ncbi:3-phosphoshikimate 1-carboxyvinyltransferase [Candidatus Gracilibacteria bacterium]|nr:3-phosphoshikimate 1-carboxyvinyltransferase [Candidatus Gracilibacteria bacterium]